MLRSSRALLTLGALVAIQGTCADSLTPLASKSFPFDMLPTAAAGSNAGKRGPQAGFNNCSAATAGEDSMCQTLVVNSASDFCVWGSPKPNETIGDTEAAEVGFCTSPERGARPIHAGVIQGFQWLYAPDYIQLAMFVDQTAFGLQPDDQGGELDPHGADEQGNPLGGIVYSNAFTHMDNAVKFNQRFLSGVLTTSDNEEELQEWVQFIGAGLICFKACRNTDPTRAALCAHIYDEIGCAYNAVADYSKINGTFTVCDSTDMTPPGVYNGSDGQLHTYTQPFSGSISVPYTPSQVTSSNCFTYQSTQLFPSLVGATATSGATPTGTVGPNGSNGGAGSSRSGSANVPAATGAGANAAVAIVAGPVTVLVGAMLGAFITMFT